MKKKIIQKIVLRVFSFILIFFACSPKSSCFASSNSATTDTLKVLANLIQHGENDSVRITANGIFKERIRSLLLQANTLNFDSVKNISTLTAPDNSFRILTWTLPSYSGSYSFFGFLQTFNKKSGTTKITDLVDSTSRVEKPEAAKLTPGKWFGAVYYKIIAGKKDGKNIYTLLGWKGVNTAMSQKLVDVLYFNGDQPMFGFPFFKTGKVYKNRLIFEFSSQAVMSLRYEESKNMIVFDHLSGSSKTNISLLSGPDGTYDALKYKKGKWILLNDIDIRSDWEPKKQPTEPQFHEVPVEKIK